MSSSELAAPSVADAYAHGTDDVTAHIEGLRLVDHHVHSCLTGTPSRDRFESMLTESDRPPPAGTSRFDSPLGYAVRRHCAPILGLPAHASPDQYLEERSTRSADELSHAFLSRSGVDEWWVDTGFVSDTVMDLDRLRRTSGNTVREVVRLETVLERTAEESTPRTLRTDFTSALETATRHAVGVKSIVAYRHGFVFDPARPTDAEVQAAAEVWFRSGHLTRVSDPVLLRMALWAGVERGLPIQLHAGFGDPDLDLHLCDPVLLTPWLREVEPCHTPVVFLHCYPFHRQAGFLAQAFPHVYFDVGLAVNYLGASADRVVAESLEHAPFGKILYSSDAWGLPELHYLGSLLWRRGLSRTLTEWVGQGEWSVPDALHVATLIARDNARRLYGITGT